VVSGREQRWDFVACHYHGAAVSRHRPKKITQLIVISGSDSPIGFVRDEDVGSACDSDRQFGAAKLAAGQ
jgi:hypothetical protein